MARSEQLSVTITGTGCPLPDPDRAGPGVLVRYGDVALQFDVGRSTVQRLAGAGIWPGDLDAVFITHHHSDHMVGLPDLILTRWTMDRFDSLEPLEIVAPVGPSETFAERMLDAWEDDIAVRITHTARTRQPHPIVRGFDALSEISEVWRQDDVVVTSVAVHHEPVSPAVAYRVDTPVGAVAISGDTIVCDEVAVLAEGANVLVYEALRFDDIRGLPEERRFILDYHADTHLIGAQAAQLDIGTLILTHLIPPPSTPDQKAKFENDIRAGGFAGEIIVADDLDTVVIGSEGLAG